MFLTENTDRLNTEEVVEAAEIETLVEDAGFEFESYAFLMEMTEDLYTIREKMMKAEHTAVVNEDVALLEEAEEGLKSKFSAHLQKISEGFKNLVSKFVTWAINLFTANQKWLDKNKEAISKAMSHVGDMKENVRYTFNTSYIKTLDQVIGRINSYKGKLASAEDKSTQDYVKEILGGKSPEEFKKSISTANGTLPLGQVFKGAQGTIAELKTAIKDAKSAGDSVSASIKQVASAVKNKEESKFKGAPQLAMALYQAKSLVISALRTAIGETFAAVRAGLKYAGGKKEEAKKDSGSKKDEGEAVGESAQLDAEFDALFSEGEEPKTKNVLDLF